MSMLATGKMAFSFASGLMTRLSLSFFALMYAQIFFVTSVRGSFFAPQISAIAALNIFGAKIPLPAFFIAMAFFLPAAFFIVVFFVVTVGALVFVVISIRKVRAAQ